MFSNSLEMNTISLSTMGLDASIKRRAVIANNIANVDTPYYKRKEVVFESELKRAIDSMGKPSIPTKTTDKRHIQFSIPKDFRSVSPKIHVEYDSNYRNDKNNVDIEKEISDEVKNSLRYKALINVINRNFQKLENMMK